MPVARPLVAIVGRPNVGKSLLFNRLAGQRLSIVEDTPGVTRDRLYATTEWSGRKFDIVDTGGIEPNTDSEILLFMREQANIAINAADVIVLVTEIGTGVTAADEDVANMLLRSRKQCIQGVGLIVIVVHAKAGIHPGIRAQCLLKNRLPRPILFVEFVCIRSFFMSIGFQITLFCRFQTFRIILVGFQPQFVPAPADSPGNLINRFRLSEHILDHPV